MLFTNGFPKPYIKVFSEKLIRRLREPLKKHVKVFGIKLVTNLPVDMNPFKVQLKNDEKAFRFSKRRCSPIHQPFIVNIMDKIEKIVSVFEIRTRKVLHMV